MFWHILRDSLCQFSESLTGAPGFPGTETGGYEGRPVVGAAGAEGVGTAVTGAEGADGTLSL